MSTPCLLRTSFKTFNAQDDLIMDSARVIVTLRLVCRFCGIAISQFNWIFTCYCQFFHNLVELFRVNCAETLASTTVGSPYGSSFSKGIFPKGDELIRLLERRLLYLPQCDWMKINLRMSNYQAIPIHRSRMNYFVSFHISKYLKRI
ncbi:unnamed protein product [Lepeophtheirus salmonis]|uniref:(salmon louse) hypothetical protein n=1 Tax=Lepeophtheirus salmonis TaxID=72036 RepID=A0A7R8CQI3_LEPSM|nr:unnamed protein product [Lepeophtheirus salmonis]CAF2861723.1 unnamed protein product [Lepeophtheirus salmonis]